MSSHFKWLEIVVFHFRGLEQRSFTVSSHFKGFHCVLSLQGVIIEAISEGWNRRVSLCSLISRGFHCRGPE